VHAAPGWYSDPQNPKLHRWWDGTAWTPRTTAPPGSWIPGQAYQGPTPSSNRALIVWGWIGALVFPIVGVIIGVRLMTTGERDQGIAITVVSAVLLLACIALAVAA
jgi:hypothetical protein